MQIDPGVPAIQLHPSQPLLASFVVLGPGHSDSKAGHRAGQIKTVYFGPHTDSPLLVIEKKTRNTRMIGVKGLHISAAEQAKGSMFLRDMYAAEGRLAHYEVFCKREKAIREGKVVGELPDGYLPKKLVAWRSGKVEAEKFELPPLDELPVDEDAYDFNDDGADAVEAAPAPRAAAKSKPARRRAAAEKPATQFGLEELDHDPLAGEAPGG